MSYLYLSTNVGVHFIAPEAANPAPDTVPPESAQFTDGTTGFYTVKDVYGLTQILASTLISNIDTNPPWINTSLAETRGFRNFAVVSTTGFVLETTRPNDLNAQLLYVSSFGHDQPLLTYDQQNIQTKTLVISNYTPSQLVTISTAASLTTTLSSLTLRDVGTGNPSSLFVSANTMYLGNNPIKPNVDLNYDIQTIAPGAPWTPANIPDLQVWFDGKDLSTMYADTSYSRTISTGEEVAVWVDKSIHQFSVIKVVDSSGFRFIDNTSSLVFVAPDAQYMDTNFSISPSTGTFSFITNPIKSQEAYVAVPFTTGDLPIAANVVTQWLEFDVAATTAFRVALIYSPSNIVYKLDFNTWDPSADPQPRTVFPPASLLHNFVVQYDFPNTSTLLARQDGVNYGRSNFDATLFTEFYSSFSTVGYRYNDSTYGDIISYNRWLEEPELQKLEGYLMWKYNIQRLLSPNHPYAANPP